MPARCCCSPLSQQVTLTQWLIEIASPNQGRRYFANANEGTHQDVFAHVFTLDLASYRAELKVGRCCLYSDAGSIGQKERIETNSDIPGAVRRLQTPE